MTITEPIAHDNAVRKRPVHEISARRAIAFLSNETQGRIFSVYFRKKGDGMMREMVCRRGVKQHRTGGTLRYDPEALLLLTVYDMVEKGYRMVNLQTLVSFNIGGETFIVTN